MDNRYSMIRLSHAIFLVNPKVANKRPCSFCFPYIVREMQLQGCSTTKQNYSKYEKGQAHISASELVAISNIIGIPIEKLFK